MLPLLFKVHFVPQPLSQRGGSGAEPMTPLWFWARGDVTTNKRKWAPRKQIALQEIKDKHPKTLAKTSSLKNIRNSILTSRKVVEWKNRVKKKNPQDIFTPETEPLVVYLQTSPVSVCVGEYDWLFPDENKITITKEMTLTVLSYKSPVMNSEMTEKIQLGCKTDTHTHTLYTFNTLYVLYICVYIVHF